MIYFIIIFSFLFEAAFSNIITLNSVFTPLFLITSLVILYPYFNNRNFNFIVVCLLCGLFYDIIFSNSAFVNTISFTVCGAFIILGYNYVNYNILSSNFFNIIIIIFYRVVSYLLLCILDYTSFNEIHLLEGIYNSLLVNVVYGIIIFILVDKLAKIFQIRKIE